jgi:hypothetical protein
MPAFATDDAWERKRAEKFSILKKLAQSDAPASGE